MYYTIKIWKVNTFLLRKEKLFCHQKRLDFFQLHPDRQGILFAAQLGMMDLIRQILGEL